MLSFVKRHLAWDDSRVWMYKPDDVIWMWKTRNICFCDHDQKMWFRYYTECIPFLGFMLFPDNNYRPYCKWLWGESIANVTRVDWTFPTEAQTQQPTTFCYIEILGIMIHTQKLFTKLSKGGTKGFFPSCSSLPVISKSSLYIFPLRQWTTDFLI